LDWQAIGLSLRLAGCATVIVCLFGLPLANWLALSRWRGKFVLEAIVALPLVLPPTVLGFYLLTAMGPNGPLGFAYLKVTQRALPFTFPGLLIASTLYSVPFAVRPFIAAFASVDRRLVEASWCLGVSRIDTFFRIVVPLAWPGLLAGVVMCFAHAVGEFGVVLMVGGNIPGVTRTVSISIYDEMQALNYQAAAQTSLFLLGFSFLALFLTSALQRRVWVP
jgi:molybdate transport system permease protein